MTHCERNCSQSYNQDFSNLIVGHSPPARTLEKYHRISHRVQCCSNIVSFLSPNIHSRHPVVDLWRWDMQCLLWAYILSLVLYLSLLSFMSTICCHAGPFDNKIWLYERRIIIIVQWWLHTCIQGYFFSVIFKVLQQQQWLILIFVHLFVHSSWYTDPSGFLCFKEQDITGAAFNSLRSPGQGQAIIWTNDDSWSISS